MHHLDQVGRLAPSSLDVSRTAATRHAHVSGVREARNRPGTDAAQRRHGWLDVVVARLSWP